MAVSGDLHQLIHSMSPSEKRYFRTYATRHVIGTENRYFHLFQAINAQDTYDEAALIAQFSGEKFTRQFSVAKNYLYHLLLQALREFHRGKSFTLRMREMLDHFELLFDKGLHRQCEKLLRRAEKAALAQDAFLYLHELKVLQKRLVKRQDPTKAKALLPELSAQEAHWLEQARLQSELRRIHDQIFALLARIGLVRSLEQAAELDSILKEMPIEAAHEAPGFESQVIYHYIHAYAARLRGQMEAVLPQYAAMVALWEAQPKRQAEFPDRYIRTLIAYLETHFQAGEYSTFEAVLSKVRAVPTQGAALRAQVFFFSHLLELRYLVHTGQLTQARQRVPQVETGLRDHEEQLGADLKVILAFNLASLFFLSGQPADCIRWTNEILNLGQAAVRKDILRAARLLDFTAHFSSGHYEYLESLRQSTLRFLKLEPGDHRFETTLVRGLWRVSRAAEVPADLTDLKEALEAVLEDQSEGVLGSEEIMHWVTAHCAGRNLEAYYTAQCAET